MWDNIRVYNDCSEIPIRMRLFFVSRSSSIQHWYEPCIIEPGTYKDLPHDDIILGPTFLEFSVVGVNTLKTITYKDVKIGIDIRLVEKNGNIKLEIVDYGWFFQRHSIARKLKDFQLKVKKLHVDEKIKKIGKIKELLLKIKKKLHGRPRDKVEIREPLLLRVIEKNELSVHMLDRVVTN